MSSTNAILIEPLSDRHDRASFACGAAALDRYIRELAGQDMRRRVASCFVLAAKDEPARIIGFYTLAATSIGLQGLPERMAKRLPRYPWLPATLLGRLAVAADRHGQGFGQILLLDAFARTLSSDIASFAVVVDPIDDRARRFYEHHRFLPLAAEERLLFLPVSEIAHLF